MSREKSIKTINIHLEKLTVLELEEVTVLTNALLAVRNVREEHQAKISGYTEEIQRLEYKAKEFQESAELTAQEVHKLRDANKQLKSQLEKQKPEIPEFVAKYIEKYKGARTVYGILDKISRNQKVYPKLYEWVFKNEERQEIFAQAWLNGYTVAKEKRFYLKNKLTGLYLALNTKENRYYEHHHDCALKNHEGWKYKFTQQEIDSMETGSYDQVEVEE